MLEIHGNHERLHCLDCEHSEPMTTLHLEPGPVPTCARCRRALKPTVVLFEEPVRELAPIRRVLAGCDLLLAVGTSAQVTPASLFPMEVGSRGGRIVELNLEPTPLSSGPLPYEVARVEGPASVTVPLVVDRALELEGLGAP